MSKSFETQVFGKWILAGEHAVLRGCPALVFPMMGKKLSLSFIDDGKPLHAEFSGSFGSEMNMLFWGVMERAFEMVGQSRDRITGSFRIENDVPIGAGLGASATLCVAISRWFERQGMIAPEGLYEFARSLENLFHGESSGVDIAVAISGKGLLFERSGKQEPLSIGWQPKWYLSYSGKRGVTADCVARVKNLWERNQALAEIIDGDMRDVVEHCKQSLAQDESERSFHQLASAIHQARSCFERWGLAGGEVGDHMNRLLSYGAVAAKPTGSGDGGYVLSLWRHEPRDLRALGLIRA